MWSVLFGISLLAVILVGADLNTLATESAPPASSPTVQDDKTKAGDAGKVTERAVKRPA